MSELNRPTINSSLWDEKIAELFGPAWQDVQRRALHDPLFHASIEIIRQLLVRNAELEEAMEFAL